MIEFLKFLRIGKKSKISRLLLLFVLIGILAFFYCIFIDCSIKIIIIVFLVSSFYLILFIYNEYYSYSFFKEQKLLRQKYKDQVFSRFTVSVITKIEYYNNPLLSNKVIFDFKFADVIINNGQLCILGECGKIRFYIKPICPQLNEINNEYNILKKEYYDETKFSIDVKEKKSGKIIRLDFTHAGARL